MCVCACVCECVCVCVCVCVCPPTEQRFNALEVDKENELAAFGDRVKAATASLQVLRQAAQHSLHDAQQRNEQVHAATLTRTHTPPPSHSHTRRVQLERLAEWFESSNELEAPAGIVVQPAHAHATPNPLPSPSTKTQPLSPSASASASFSPAVPTPSPRGAPAAAASPTVFSPSRNHIRRSLGGDSGQGAVVLCTQVQHVLRRLLPRPYIVT